MKYQVLLMYKYIPISNVKELKSFFEKITTEFNFSGRIIISPEGINLTICGLKDDTNNFIKVLKNKKEFKDIDVKKSLAVKMVFPKMSIRIKNEIVTTRFDKKINPVKKTGRYITAKALDSKFDNKDNFLIVDMRNEYEYSVGKFDNSIHFSIYASRDLKNNLDKLKKYKYKELITVCTGGVRCEKMSAFLIDQGFKNVYQLKNGIHGYLEQYPKKNFKGGLYTFDNRIVMNFSKNFETIGKCFSCGVSTEIFSHCKNAKCHRHLIICIDCIKTKDIFCSRACERKVIYLTTRIDLLKDAYSQAELKV